MPVDDVIAAVRASRARREAELLEFLSIPSVSAQPKHAPDVRRAARWLAGKLKRAGLEDATVRETSGHPVVTAAWRHAPGRPTVLVYGHYDVQPVEPVATWARPPFEPVVAEGRVWGRGACDDKGPLLTHVNAVEAWLSTTGALPVNVVFLLEGEEEMSSAGMEGWLLDHRDIVRADLALLSDTAMWDADTPAISHGLRGVCTYDLIVEGPKTELHSGVHGGAVANPAEALARILAAMKDARGHVTVPGFYDDVRSPTAAERKALAALPWNDATYRRRLGVPALAGHEGKSTLERTWTLPTFEVNGITGGYSGDGFKTVIPPVASAKVSCRTVPDQDPKKIDRLVARALKAAAPPGVKVTVKPLHSGRPELFDTDHPALRLAADALAATYGRPAVFRREGGSIPVVSMMRSLLKLPVVMMGAANEDENLHAPNESFRLANFERVTGASVRFLAALGR